MSSEVTLLKAADYREMPWKNGGGVTTEIAVYPSEAGVHSDIPFLWRLSVARIDRSGPFSLFPGYDRTMVLLDGDGVEMNLGPRGLVRLDRPFVPYAFRGEWPAECALLGGPVRDFNVMIDRARVACQPRVLMLGSGAFRCPLKGSTSFLFMMRGGATARIPGVDGGLDLSAHETLRLGAVRRDSGMKLVGHGRDAVACLVDFVVRGRSQPPPA